MQITFETEARSKGIKSRGTGRLVINKSGNKPMIFHNGVYRTSLRNEVEELLHSRLMKEGTIQLVTDPELVDKYLRGEEPEKLTKEVLAKVDTVGLRKLADIAGLSQQKHRNYDNVIRTMLRDTEVTSIIQGILDAHKLGEEETEKGTLLDQALEAGVIYRAGPWFKFRKHEEKSDEDFAISKTESEVHIWLSNPENKKLTEEKLES